MLSTRGAHTRSDFPEEDPRLRVNLLWSAEGEVTAEPVGEPSAEVAALADGPALEVAGRLLE